MALSPFITSLVESSQIPDHRLAVEMITVRSYRRAEVSRLTVCDHALDTVFSASTCAGRVIPNCADIVLWME